MNLLVCEVSVLLKFSKVYKVFDIFNFTLKARIVLTIKMNYRRSLLMLKC